MPDREKVIEAYECCKNSFDRICEKCPYEKDCYHDGMPMFVIEKMVALLKEQEAVEPILIREGRNKNYNDYVCPRCVNGVVYKKNYCSECGVRFLWGGR